jgi:DUF3071 family protein
MRRLRFVELAEDGEHLVVAADDDDRYPEPGPVDRGTADGPGAGDGGVRYLVPIDDRLRAALAPRQRTVPVAVPAVVAGPALRPKDIQIRIRAGASPEQVAAESGMSVDRVMRFAYPVLAERAQVVEQARRARVRRGDPISPTLAERVDGRLEARGVDPESVKWDSWKREDGTWLVAANWHSAERDRTARWMFELTTKVLVPEEDMAQHLTGEEERPFSGRLTPVTPLAAAARAAANGEHATEPIPSVADLVPTRRPRVYPDDPDETESGRVRVPSWDEILLGPRRPR